LSEVSVPTRTPKFPSKCSKCLEETDLTTYTAKWQKENWVDVPICKSCTKTLLGETRRKYTIYFAISGAICWGLALGLTYFFGFGPFLSGFAFIAKGGEIGYYVGIALLFVSLALWVVPLFFLYHAIKPHGVVNWPVKIVKTNVFTEIGAPLTNVFSFENEAYSKLFEAANSSSTKNAHMKK